MISNFLFHRVNPQRDSLWDPMDVKLFDKVIKHIKNNFEVAVFENLLLSDADFIKNKYATIMFDDGYRDNFDFAAEILQRNNCQASFYVVTNSIDNNVPTWTYIFDYLFQNARQSNLLLDFDFLPKDLIVSNIQSTQDAVIYASRLKPFLKTLPNAKRSIVLQRVRESFSDVVIPKIMMTWDEIRELKNAGHYIGSHTVNHSMLGTMEKKDEILYELEYSGQVIERELGVFPLSISYPVGSFNTATKELSKQAGYKIGLAVGQEIYNPNVMDFYEVPRIELYNEPWWKTRLRISHKLEKIKSIIRYK
jgi:peptidoglycan/xylan/chitin deacetylase (PgdA/CDA1 family)